MPESTPLMSAAARFKARLDSRDIIAAPGAPDALSARLVAAAGFEAIYMTGLGATAVRLGQPDLGLMTQTEMADHARSLVRATRTPIIADADTGYGGPLNVRRTVDEYVQAGVAAMHLEDQEMPKQCGQLTGARLVSLGAGALRVKAAADARAEAGGDLTIIGRTDALQTEGLAAAADRAHAYFDAGADLVFVDGVKTRAEVEGIAEQVHAPKVISLVDGTDAASLTLVELQEMEFSVALYAVTALFAAASATQAALKHLHDQSRLAGRDSQHL